MAGQTDRSVALIAIHPTYAEAILDGRKTVEFRRSMFPAVARFVVLYATAPVRRITGWFEVDSIERGKPEDLWRRHHRGGAVDGTTFQRYFSECSMGAAIRVQRATRLRRPIGLAALSPALRPPQSFQYLDRAAAESIGLPVVAADPSASA